MIKKQDIISMARRVTKISRGSKQMQSVNPRREWLLGVLIFFIVLVIGSVANARNYLYYENIEATVSGDVSAIKKYRESDAKVAAEIFIMRSERYVSLVGSQAVQEPEPPVEVINVPETDSEEVSGGTSETEADPIEEADGGAVIENGAQSFIVE
jgi:hypothetical protein